jgi:MoaA/NifB/PqqE/SkfB family radical SAM enzyme
MSEERKKYYPLYDSPLLKAQARVEEGQARGTKVLVDARGPLAHLPLIKSALQMFDGQIAACADREKLCLSTWIPPIPSRAFSRLADSRLRALLGRRTPDQVTISITEECPNRCVHCALPNSGNKLSLTSQTVKDIISQILEMGTTLVIFDGGEPALYRELPELVASVDDRAISTLFTSGAGFTSALARRLKEAGLYAVNVSLDSPIEAEHDAMRGREGVYCDAMHAIENALAAGLLVDLYVVLRRENMSHLQRFHDLARCTGVHELTFFEVVSTGRWLERQNIALLPGDHALLADFVRRAGDAGAPRIFSVPQAYQRFGCFAASSWMHITPAGEVYPCSCYPQSWGSIFEEPIEKIWQRMSAFPYKKSKVCPMRK